MLILFTCWKLWGDALKLPAELMLTDTLDVCDRVSDGKTEKVTL